MIRILSDDTDVFVLLIYWLKKADLQYNVQMERWDGAVLDINATHVTFGQMCLQLPALPVLTHAVMQYPIQTEKEKSQT